MPPPVINVDAVSTDVGAASTTASDRNVSSLSRGLEDSSAEAVGVPTEPTSAIAEPSATSAIRYYVANRGGGGKPYLAIAEWLMNNKEADRGRS
jgi:hypothetical protein